MWHQKQFFHDIQLEAGLVWMVQNGFTHMAAFSTGTARKLGFPGLLSIFPFSLFPSTFSLQTGRLLKLHKAQGFMRLRWKLPVLLKFSPRTDILHYTPLVKVMAVHPDTTEGKWTPSLNGRSVKEFVHIFNPPCR